MGDEDAMASERRLAYVAITRGQDNVTVLCPMENHVGKPAGPSQFVGEACISIEKGRGADGEESVSASFADDDFYTEVFDATPWYLID
jgi:superfamily I DNA/RNA helicase